MRRAGPLLALLLACWLPANLLAKETVRVQVVLPLPEKIDMRGVSTILLTSMVLSTDNPRLDLNREMIRLMKRELGKNTPLEVLEVEPPPLPEQPLEELVANQAFWKEMAEKYGADLILTGGLGYLIEDRSGFVQQDFISPATGQRVRRTRYADREGFDLDLHLYFLRGSSGKLLYDDQFSAESTFDGKGNDALSVLHGMFGSIEADVIGIVSPKLKTESRILFKE